MGVFTKRRLEFDGPRSPAAKRAAMLPTHELVPWAETCLYQIGRSLSDHQRGEDTALAEAGEAVAVLQAIMGEIKSRAGETAVSPPETQ